jgi:hypothetical protein
LQVPLTNYSMFFVDFILQGSTANYGMLDKV